MEQSEIDILSDKNSDVNEVTGILIKFLEKNVSIYKFSSLLTQDKQKLWSALLELMKGEHPEILPLSLTATRILSRDKDNVEEILNEDMMSVFIEKAGYTNLKEEDQPNKADQPSKADQPNKANHINTVEAIKILCNLAYNCAAPRKLFIKLNGLDGLVNRLRVCNLSPFNDDILLYDLKLLFLLTALSDAIEKIKVLEVMDYLIDILELIIDRATNDTDNSGDAKKKTVINDKHDVLIREVLKVLFNLFMTFSYKKKFSLNVEVDESQKRLILNIMPIFAILLNSDMGDFEKLMNMRDHVANVLTILPYSFYNVLTPKLEDQETAAHVYEGYNMDAMAALLALLHHKLHDECGVNSQIGPSPVLTVFIKASRGCRMQRKYLRSVVLPPLRDVSLPPEQGDTLRNQLCRLLTTPLISVRNLAAEFLFILCKEKVGRMVKYTGFGNAAGHLAQNGLLGGHEPSVDYSSSDDSDTEEYLEAQPNIDPVVGCTRPPRLRPFDGMTEEQKEYEALKLVELLDAMTARGVIRPARIGDDGKPEAIDHVLQLQEK